jgi:TonB family protein
MADLSAMKHRMRSARRCLRQTVASALALVLAVGVLFAQDSSGNTQGSVNQDASFKAAIEDLQNEPPPATVTVNGVKETVYRAKDATTPPRPIKQPQPGYTDKARRDKLWGVVTLTAVVTREGGMSNITVRRNLGDGLDEEAVKAVRKWKWVPATKDGKPVAVQIVIEVGFPRIG